MRRAFSALTIAPAQSSHVAQGRCARIDLRPEGKPVIWIDARPVVLDWPSKVAGNGAWASAGRGGATSAGAGSVVPVVVPLKLKGRVENVDEHSVGLLTP